MKGLILTVSMLAITMIGSACSKDSAKTDDAPRGEAGESCSSRRDCVDGLACVDNRCVKPGSGTPKTDGGTMAEVVDTRGLPGESCTRRADCRPGNACIDNVCVSEAALPTGMIPSERGQRGESCQARNDCMDALACINQHCIENDFSFTVQTKECFRVQCEADDDCCETFIAPANCPSLKVACDGGDTVSCSQYDLQCECRQACQNNLCTYTNTCKADVDCGSTLLHCFNSRCAQCMTASDCTSVGTTVEQQCVAGVCQAGCKRNEQCPLFNECMDGECVEVGCKSARECFFATKSPLSECKDGSCVTPCKSDAECGELQLCNEGQCVFVGCENNDECRALLGLANQPGSDHAVCREPDH